jgi:hypothetical protein
MLDASRFGERLRFPGAELSYRALALPAWLPAHVPPVAPQVSADPLPARWPLQRPLAWRIDVTGGYSEDDLHALLDLQMRDSPALGVYPPLIETMPMDAGDSPLSRYRITLYLQPRVDGSVTVPTLRFPWYDAGRGQLASTAIPCKALDVFDPRWRLARQLTAAGAAVLLLIAACWWVRRMVRWRWARRRGLRAIREAVDVAGLDRAVRQFSLRGQPVASSLGEWQRRLRQETETCEVADAVRQLEQQRFGLASPTLAALQQRFLRALARACPMR